jgi:hypothetical protein
LIEGKLKVATLPTGKKPKGADSTDWTDKGRINQCFWFYPAFIRPISESVP